MIEAPRVVMRQQEQKSPWVTLVSRSVAWSTGEPQTFHSLAQADYVSVLAVNASGLIPLVTQFRPAVERMTLELPGGINDSSEAPSIVAARELFEETGFTAANEPVLLRNLTPDTGRLENRFWCFYVDAEEAVGWQPEAQVERVLFSRAQLREAILEGSFEHALHIALLNLAIMRGRFRWED